MAAVDGGFNGSTQHIADNVPQVFRSITFGDGDVRDTAPGASTRRE